jgi:hypothetical protein
MHWISEQSSAAEAKATLLLGWSHRYGQHIYTINTRREQTQNNSRRATYIHNQYLAWTNTKRRATHIQNQKLVMSLVSIVYMCCPSWVILCLFTPSRSWVILCLVTPSIDCVYVLPVFLFLFTPSIDCVYMLILGVNKHKIIQDGKHIYTINTWREKTQNNSRRVTHIHN